MSEKHRPFRPQIRPPQAPARPPGKQEPTAADPSDSNRARQLLGIPARHEQICRVKCYAGEIGIRILDNTEVAEAVEATAAWADEHGFGREPPPGSFSWLEFGHRLASEMLARALVDPKSGFRLWTDAAGKPSADALNLDLTREDLDWLEEKRQEHQINTCPRFEDLTQAQLEAVLDEMVGGDDSPFDSLRRWPRQLLLSFVRTTVVRLRRFTGSKCSDSSTPATAVAP